MNLKTSSTLVAAALIGLGESMGEAGSVAYGLGNSLEESRLANLPEANRGDRIPRRAESSKPIVGCWMGDGVEPQGESRQQRRRKERVARKSEGGE